MNQRARRSHIRRPVIEPLEKRLILSAAMVRDINTDASSSDSNPHGFFVLGGQTFFFGTDGADRIGLWKTDGTAAGTVFLKAFGPIYKIPGDDRSVLVVGNDCYFAASDPAHGTELWKTDGTSSGTVLVADINLGPNDSSPQYFTAVGNILYFRDNDGKHGAQLWRSDGTAAGTIMLTTWNANGTGSNPYPLAGVGGKLLFSAPGPGLIGNQLWSTDGTTAGTAVLKLIGNGSADPGFVQSTGLAGSHEFAVSNGKLYFAATDVEYQNGNNVGSGRELWVSDGTSGGTTLVSDIVPGPFGSFPDQVTDDNGTLYFDAIYGGGDPTQFGLGYNVRALYRIDTASSSPQPVLVGVLGQSAYPTLGVWGASLYMLDTVSSGGAATPGLFKTDPSSGSLTLVKQLPPGVAASITREFAGIGPTLIFQWNPTGPPQGSQLYATDGTGAGTSLVQQYPRSSLGEVFGMADSVYLAANDGIHGTQPWKVSSTGLASMVIDLNPENAGSDPSTVVDVNGIGLFAAQDEGHGSELWATDGTFQGTYLVKDINPGPADGITAPDLIPASFDSFHALGPVFQNRVYFAANDGVHGNSLWASDGTANGTVMIAQITPDFSDSQGPHPAAVFHNRLYFDVSDSTQGYQLWSTDGTTGGTTLMSPTIPSSSVPYDLTVSGDALYFGTAGQLWKTDGTSAGTQMLAGFAGLGPFDLTPLNGQVYFRTIDSSGQSLYRSDGTAGGTVTVFRSGVTGGLSALSQANGRLFFIEFDGVKQSVWLSDGTTSGTNPLAGVPAVPLYTGGRPVFLIPADNLEYWIVPSPQGPEDLWRIDGTPDGTVHLQTLTSITPSTMDVVAPRGVVGGKFYFANSAHWPELWQSDGTADGTFVVYRGHADDHGDINIANVGTAGGRTYFAGFDPVHGTELWTLDPQHSAIVGNVYQDDNHDGFRDPTEIGLAGVTVFLDANNNGILDPGELSTTTDSSGNYEFPVLSPGTYTVREVLPGGYVRTAPLPGASTLTLRPGEVALGPSFGNTATSTVPLDFGYLVLLTRHYNQAGTFADGDLNGDDWIGFDDLVILARNYGKSASLAVSNAAAVSADLLTLQRWFGDLARKSRVKRTIHKELRANQRCSVKAGSCPTLAPDG